MSGFVAFDRAVFGHPALTSANHFGAWALLVGRARWPQGTVAGTWPQFCQAFGWTELSVKRCLQHFQQHGLLLLEHDRRRAFVTIIDRSTFSIERSTGNGTGSPLGDEPSMSSGRFRAPFGADREPMPNGLRQAIFTRDGHVCRYCGENEGPFEIDHVLAVANGGDNSAKNLVVACVPCNRSKGALMLSEWMVRRG